MNRRTVLQSLLALIGFGAAKAVAKTEAPNWQNYSVGCDISDETRALEAASSPQFDAAIGVVKRGHLFVTARISLADPTKRDSGWSGGSSIFAGISYDLIAEEAVRHNAMIFAEANGPGGAQLIEELMKRCPERVWHGLRVWGKEPRTVTVRGCGGVFLSKSEQLLGDLELLNEEWTNEDPDEKVARYLALFGKRVLTEETVVIGGDQTLFAVDGSGKINRVE